MEVFSTVNYNELTKVTQKPRFYIPIDPERAMEYLFMAYEAEVSQRGGKVEDTEIVKKRLQPISRWITDKNLKPGILLYGSIGTGKTTALKALLRLINAFCKAERDDVRLFDCGNVIECVKAKGIVEAYQKNERLYGRMFSTEMLAIDELGVESIDIKTYGNSSEPIIDLLSSRYDSQRLTAISSNLDIDQIGSRYGQRLADRFKEMFHKVAFVGSSYRGQSKQ